jgi:hypothetical protein
VSFLAPWGLLLAAAAAVPLLLHLLRRRTGTRVEFPALRYLLRAQKEHAREVRLRNLLLMAIRIAIVLALALALARPLGWLPLGAHAPTAVVLLVDNSLSSSAAGRDGPPLTRLVEGARALVDASRTADRLWVVGMDGEVVTGSPGDVRAALDAMRALDGAGDASEAWARATGVLGASGLTERRLVILTDAQATSWRTVEVTRVPEAPVTLFAPAHTPPTNRAIAAVEVEPRVWSPRGALRASIDAPDSASWRLALEERTVARGTRAPGTPFLARVQARERGWRAGSLELEPDEFRGDDLRHFAVRIGQPPAVRVAADAGVFARGAVDALEQGGRVRRGTEIEVASAVAARRSQPALLFAPGDPLRVADANRALERAGIPWRFGAVSRGAAPLRGAEVDGAVATLWYALETRAGGPAPAGAAVDADTLVRVGTAPWAVAGEGYVLVASPADPAATDLPLRAAFIPWIDRMITDHLAAEGGLVIEAAPGARAVAARGAGPAALLRVPAGADALEAPDGSLTAVRAGDALRAPWRTGVYFWRRGSERAGALVVNPEPDESDLRALAPDSLAALLGDALPVSRPADLARAVFAGTARRSLDTSLLWLALLLLAAELLLARRRAATATDPVST